MAKGFVTGIQFEGLFQDDLFFTLAAHANHMAARIAQSLTQCGYTFYAPLTTNQLFPILPNRLLPLLVQQFVFSVQTEIDATHSAIRLVTSWATNEESVAALVKFLREHRVSGALA